MMDEPTWDRGDGQPDPQHLDDTIADILDACRPHRPVEIILFGSGARGELTPTSDADLLVVLADRDQEFAKPVTIAFSVMDGHEPRVDIIVAFQHEVRDAVRSLTSILRTAREEGVPVYRDDRHQPYALRPRPPAVHRAEDANTPARRPSGCAAAPPKSCNSPRPTHVLSTHRTHCSTRRRRRLPDPPGRRSN